MRGPREKTKSFSSDLFGTFQSFWLLKVTFNAFSLNLRSDYEQRKNEDQKKQELPVKQLHFRRFLKNTAYSLRSKESSAMPAVVLR